MKAFETRRLAELDPHPLSLRTFPPIQFHRTYKFDAVLGGSEEVLADLGVRQALRLAFFRIEQDP